MSITRKINILFYILFYYIKYNGNCNAAKIILNIKNVFTLLKILHIIADNLEIYNIYIIKNSLDMSIIKKTEFKIACKF